jgi:hypothetical protein
MVSDIQKGLTRFFENHIYHLNNSYFFAKDWESDFFSMTRTGYTYEVEIKISASDFKADFKKKKHKLFEGAIVGSNKKGRTLVRSTPKLMPNRFFFCVPEDLEGKVEIPPYAGLLIYSSSIPTIRKVKEAPFIHKDKPDLTTKLLHKFYWKSITLEKELEKYRLSTTKIKKRRRKRGR